MHVLLLIGIIPFVLLFLAMGFFALMLVVSAIVEFPVTVLLLITLIALGLVGRKVLPNLNKKQHALCEQM